MPTIQICNPTAPLVSKSNRGPTPKTQLAGVRIAVINNGWMSMTRISKLLAERLPAEYGAAEVEVHVVEPNGGATEEVLAAVAKRADLAIVGLANCGGCTSWSVQNQVDLMSRGVYSVLLVTERYKKLADVISRGRGMKDAPSVVLPITEETEYGKEEMVDEIAAQALRGAVELLAVRRVA
jgi:hypothetical protein